MSGPADLEAWMRAIARDELAKARNDQQARGPAYLKAADFAARNSIALSTVREAIADGRLPVKRMGRAVRIAENATIAPRQKGDLADARFRQRLAKYGGRR